MSLGLLFFLLQSNDASDILTTNTISHYSPIPFVEQAEGRQMKEKLWAETKAEVSQYTMLPESLAM